MIGGRRPVRLCVLDCVSAHTSVHIQCNKTVFSGGRSSYPSCELVWADRHRPHGRDSLWQESSACVDSRPSGPTLAGFDLRSHCRLLCILGLLSARHRIHLECPVPLPPLKDQVSLFKAEGALWNPTATTSQITLRCARHKSATELEDWNESDTGNVLVSRVQGELYYFVICVCSCCEEQQVEDVYSRAQHVYQAWVRFMFDELYAVNKINTNCQRKSNCLSVNFKKSNYFSICVHLTVHVKN